MQASSSFKLAFLKQMLVGFRLTAVSSKSLSLEERSDAIKLSADVAMAAARGGTRWARGLIASLAKDERRRPLLRSILGGDQYERLLMVASKSSPTRSSWKKASRCKRIVRRSFRVRSKAREGKRKSRSDACILARSIVRKKMQTLQKLVPGGEAMDGLSLLDEALDYVISLRAQVELMRRLSKLLPNHPFPPLSSDPIEDAQYKTEKLRLLANEVRDPKEVSRRGKSQLGGV